MDLPNAAGAASPWLAWAALAAGTLALIAGLWALTLWRRLRQLSTPAGPPDAATSGARGLMSREAFDAAIEQATTQVPPGPGSLCLLMADIDGFTAVNDSLGHAAADAVLQTLARRLDHHTPGKCGFTRLGGDEFLLAIACSLPRAQALARELIESLAQPVYTADGRLLRLTASIGIAAWPQHGARERLTGQAQMALRTVKQTGGHAWAVFDPQMAVDQRAQSAMLTDLRQAVARRQLELFYQPKIDARTLRVTAAEALLRWHHPTQGVISPGVFIPLAERHGVIGEIGNWVIGEACRQAGVWRQAGLRMRVAINLSAFQMRQDDLVARLQEALAVNQLQPGRFTVEITETLALENTQATQRTFEGLRQAGLHVSIDDFGAGQTSLGHLRRLPASELKMDIALVRDIAISEDARKIADAVIRLAQALDMHVVAEGVETAEQRDLLVAMGCDELQGYLFARPMSASALGLWAMDDGATTSPAFATSLFQDTVPAH
jgi:diguanylate cyclase (GGDEF)-like protein